MVFNKIPLEEIEVGMSISYTQTVTDADIKGFAGISGDRNPIHLDEEYAKKSRFKKRIAHGMMTASYFSSLFGTKIPGEGCVYTHQTLNFKRPVYINDTVIATVTVTSVDLDKRRVRFKTTCKVDNKVVTDGEAELYVPAEFQKNLICKKEDLIKYKTQIFELFKNSFGTSIDEKLWEWAYVSNPNGDPIVSLYFDKNKLIGHYAVIPISFKYKQRKLKGALSMTTMVDSAYRKYGIFIDQANEVYEQARQFGYHFVYGFPNKKSAPGFKKRLGWSLDEGSYVAKLTKNELQQIQNNISKEVISFNLEDLKNVEWRLNKPNQEYMRIGSSILKKFDQNFDIIYTDYSFEDFNQSFLYNILLDQKEEKYLDKKEFDYIFGFRLFDKTLRYVEFKKDLIMSDVF